MLALIVGQRIINKNNVPRTALQIRSGNVAFFFRVNGKVFEFPAFIGFEFGVGFVAGMPTKLAKSSTAKP